MLAAQIDSFKHLEHHDARAEARALRLRCSYNAIMSHDDARPRVGISRCLLGDEVRYDGGHKRDTLVVATLGSLVEWVPVCPEVEAGMGTPREAIDLVARDDGVPAGAARVRAARGDRAARTGPTRSRASRRLERASFCANVSTATCSRPIRQAAGSNAFAFTEATRCRATGAACLLKHSCACSPVCRSKRSGRLQDAVARAGFIDRVFERWRRRTRR